MKLDVIEDRSLERLRDRADKLIAHIDSVTNDIDYEIGRIERLQVENDSLTSSQEVQLQALKIEIYKLDHQIRIARRPHIQGAQK